MLPALEGRLHAKNMVVLCAIMPAMAKLTRNMYNRYMHKGALKMNLCTCRADLL